MSRSTAALFVAAMVLMAAYSTEAVEVRQLFCWKLTKGVGAAAGAKNVRVALYNSWNKVNKGSVSGWWLGQQNDGLLFAVKDDTWCDIAGITDWADVEAYKAFKVWEKEQPTYKALDVSQKLRLVTYK